MEEMSLLVDLHVHHDRQGPGSDVVTLQAAALSGLQPGQELKVLDVGCGTGAASLVLTEHLQAQVTAVDFLPDFLDKLNERAAERGVAGQIETLSCDMSELPFPESSFDVIWSEGAVYNMGFGNGVSYWQRFLKPGGALVVKKRCQ